MLTPALGRGFSVFMRTDLSSVSLSESNPAVAHVKLFTRTFDTAQPGFQASVNKADDSPAIRPVQTPDLEMDHVRRPLPRSGSDYGVVGRWIPGWGRRARGCSGGSVHAVRVPPVSGRVSVAVTRWVDINQNTLSGFL